MVSWVAEARAQGGGCVVKGRQSEGPQWQQPLEKVHTCSGWHFVPTSIPYRINLSAIMPGSQPVTVEASGFSEASLHVSTVFVISVNVDPLQGGAAVLRMC